MKRFLPLLSLACFSTSCDQKEKSVTTEIPSAVAPARSKNRDTRVYEEAATEELRAAVLEFVSLMSERNSQIQKWATAVQAGHTGDEPGGKELDATLTEKRALLGDYFGKGQDKLIHDTIKAHDDLIAVRDAVEKLEEDLRQQKNAQAAFSELESRIHHYEQVLKQPSPAPNRSAPEQAKFDPLIGVPNAAIATIRQQAALKWASDPEMRAYEEKKQAEGWQKMNGFETKAFGSMPYAEKKGIVDAAKVKWATDYSMQAYEFEKQAQAWATIELWEKQGIPGVPFAQRKTLLDAGRSKWGRDYPMVIYEVEKLIAR